MSRRVELADMLAEYDNVKDPNIQAIISSKWEFAELASGPNDPIPVKGDFYNHQKLVQRIMMVYHRLMILHETGTGKSFLIGAVGEALRKGLQFERGIKGVIVVVTGPTQETDVKNLLVCKSTGGKYLNDKILYAASTRNMKNAASKSIARWYQIERYQSFAKKLQKMTDSEISKKYSGYAIFFDEIHNLRINHKLDVLSANKLKDKENTYKQMWRLSHIPNNVKVIGMTASLVIKSVKEAGPILNLVLPIDNQIGRDVNLKTISLKKLEPYVRGHISFARALDTGAVKNVQGKIYEYISRDEDGKVLYESQVKIVKVVMSQKQTKSYVKAYYTKGNGDSKSGLRQAGRQASGGIFPDGSWGNAIKREDEGGNVNITELKGFDKYVKPEAGWYTPTPEYREYLENPNYLKELSAKDHYIVHNIIAKSKGIVVIYYDLVTGSGLIKTALALQYALGYSRFSQSVGDRPYCYDPDRKRKISMTPGKRFAAIMQGTKPSQIGQILEIMSSYENRHGDYIQVLFLSSMASEGISVNNATTFVQYGGLWNPSEEYQARSRVFRSTSHVDLIRERIENGEDDLRVEVKVYNLAAEPNKQFVKRYQSRYRGEDDPKVKNTDLLLYRLSEAKNIASRGLIRKLKKLAIDCNIHHQRNIRLNDVDGSPECDYDECKYKCFQDPFEKYDYSTYDVYYSGEAVNKITPEIKNYFRFNGSGTLISIRDYLDPKKESHALRLKYIQLALAKLIVTRTPIIDRFGYEVYIKESNGMYFLTNEFPLQTYNTDQTMAYYGKTLIAEMATPFKQAIEQFENKKMTSIIDAIKTLEDEKKIESEIKSYPVTSRSIILEDAFLRKIKGEDSNYIKTVVKIFKNNIVKMKEPVEEIRNKAKELSRKGRGRTKVEESDDDSEEEYEGKGKSKSKAETVYVNTLYTQEDKGVKYGASTRWREVRGKLRLLKMSEGVGWRDMSDYEQEVYSEKIRSKIKTVEENLADNPVYGIITADGAFRIVAKYQEKDKTSKRKSKKGEKIDGRTVHTGKISHGKPELTDISWHAGVKINLYSVGVKAILRNKNYTDQEKRERLERIVVKNNFNIKEVKKWDMDRVTFYASLLTGYNKDRLLGVLKKYLEKNNLVIKA